MNELNVCVSVRLSQVGVVSKRPVDGMAIRHLQDDLPFTICWRRARKTRALARWLLCWLLAPVCRHNLTGTCTVILYNISSRHWSRTLRSINLPSVCCAAAKSAMDMPFLIWMQRRYNSSSTKVLFAIANMHFSGSSSSNRVLRDCCTLSSSSPSCTAADSSLGIPEKRGTSTRWQNIVFQLLSLSILRAYEKWRSFSWK